MPIYEYKCTACGREFEELVFKQDQCPPCPACNSEKTEKLMSRCVHKSVGVMSGTAEASPAPSFSGSGGCAGCSGGNCSSCGS